MNRNFVKIFLISSALVLLAAGCSEEKPLPVPEGTPRTNQSAPTPAPSGQTQTKENADKPDYSPGTAQTGVNIGIHQTVQGSSLNNATDSIGVGTNALVALKLFHKVETKSYVGLGEMVTSIDGREADSKHFWEFFVNGKSSNVGASTYVLKANDNIEWKLSEIK